MAARARHPHPTLRQAILRFRAYRQHMIKDSAGNWVHVGPFRETQQLRDMTDNMLQQDVDEKSQQNYWVRGWSRNEFDYKRPFDNWVSEHIPYVDYQLAKRNILAHGQTAIARVRDDGDFLRIDLEPVPGRWWMFKTQEMLDYWRSTNYRFHISLTRKEHSKEDPAIFERIKTRWDGQTVTIRIEEVKPSGNLMLDMNHGIGADTDVQHLYRTGTFAGKYENGYGLHISM